MNDSMVKNSNLTGDVFKYMYCYP